MEKSRRNRRRAAARARPRAVVPSAPVAEPSAEARSSDDICPVVGIGASAGGLEAFTRFLKVLPPDTGLAYVLVQHLDPKHESAPTEILSRASSMPVSEVEDGMRVESNHIYVIPPKKKMAILHGTLNLMPRVEGSTMPMPMDFFLRSLAEDLRDKAIGVILSGNASDGTLGLKAIKSEGGITFAQEERSAKYDGMPHSAIASQCVDFVLEPEGIAHELARIGKHPYASVVREEPEVERLPGKEDALSKIFIILRSVKGVDFSFYKRSTIGRRILRRMVLSKADSLPQYVELLKKSSGEVNLLYLDLLINVTSFFREPGSFEVLKKKVLPALVKDRSAGAALRVWVPGCSTGEEAYSLAICLLEFLQGEGINHSVQIFATDVSEAAIEKARSGIYPETIAADVSSERLRRFFVKEEDGYRINKVVRDLCVFARQNVLRDPPFSKMDLISCRNLLIYLAPPAQRRVLPVFHYALNSGGFLILGESESIGSFSDLFTPIDKKCKFYVERSIRHLPPLDLGASGFSLSQAGAPSETERQEADRIIVGGEVQRQVDRLLLNRYSPPAVLIDDQLQILQFRGRVSPYLDPAPGKASLNLMKMAREGLQMVLRAMIQKALKTNSTVRKQGVEFKHEGRIQSINLEVISVVAPALKEKRVLVVFEPPVGPARNEKDGSALERRSKGGGRKSAPRDRVVAQLRHELEVTGEYLQSTIEEKEAANEELRSANEEIQSSNEELQSTNEELETAKEELQSTNEELTTVNEELQNRNFELSQVNNDLYNLLANVSIPILMPGTDLRIRRFTPTAAKALNLIPTDLGRPISDLRPNVNIENLDQLILDAIDTLSVMEREVQDAEGRWYSLRVRPYKTSENKIEGAVLTLTDIDTLKTSLEEVNASRDYCQAVVDAVREPLLVLDAESRVTWANQVSSSSTSTSSTPTAGTSWPRSRLIRS